MSLLSKMLDDLDERQADLAGERDPILDGLQKVTDTHFHLRDHRRMAVTAGVALVALIAAAGVVYYLLPVALLPSPMSKQTATGTQPAEPAMESRAIVAGTSSSEAVASEPVVVDRPGNTPEVVTRTTPPGALPDSPPTIRPEPARPTLPALADWFVHEDDPGKATVTLRLSERVEYRLYPSSGDDRVTLEFVRPVEVPGRFAYIGDHGIVRRIDRESPQGASTQLVLQFTRPAKVLGQRFVRGASAFDLVFEIGAVEPAPAQIATTTPAPAAMSPQAPPITDARAPSPPETQSPPVQTPDASTDAASFSRVGVSADDVYKKGLQLYQSGQVQEGMAQLRRALERDPLHGEARSTLASCLVEQRQTDAALTLLSEGLQLEPRQFKWAELKAHLLVDANRIDLAIDTLQREKPAAADNPDYLAFLAALLQRENRHAEAAALYEDIVKIRPANGIWWMGLAISLERTDRPGDAKGAYQQALADTSLSADLKGYINKRIMTLSRRQ